MALKSPCPETECDDWSYKCAIITRRWKAEIETGLESDERDYGLTAVNFYTFYFAKELEKG